MTAVTSFRSMDESTAEQWAVIGVETAQNQGRVAERVLGIDSTSERPLFPSSGAGCDPLQEPLSITSSMSNWR